jgi:hypothetical protein
MKFINKKDFNMFYKIMLDNKDKSTIAIHNLYLKQKQNDKI